jgi:hypothetical protein
MSENMKVPTKDDIVKMDSKGTIAVAKGYLRLANIALENRFNGSRNDEEVNIIIMDEIASLIQRLDDHYYNI